MLRIAKSVWSTSPCPAFGSRLERLDAEARDLWLPDSGTARANRMARLHAYPYWRK
jgi:hypothetical protein